MNNKLIKTNTLWYKIQNFFKRIFCKETEIKDIQPSEIIATNKNTASNNDLKERLKIENKQQDLAEKLLYGEVSTNELEENEVDEMIDYFKNDIEKIDNELLRIKQHILAMQKELKQ